MQIIIQGPTYGQPQPIRLNVSGEETAIPVNTRVACTEAMLLALRDTDHVIQVFGDAAADAEPAPAGSGDGGEGGGGASSGDGSAADPPDEVPLVEPEAPAAHFLDRSVTVIIADLGGLSHAQLLGAREAEDAGKTRKSLIAAIDERLAALAAA